MHPLVVNKRDSAYEIDITRNGDWGNPFPLNDFRDREACLVHYQEWLLRHSSRGVLAYLHQLRGKTLGCVCAPRACHGDILARMAGNPFTQRAYAFELVVVTGSRHWDDEATVRRELGKLPQRSIVAHGDSPRGLDKIADRVARDLGLRVERFRVDGEVDGPWPYAGFVRNGRMLDSFLPDRVLAFRAWGKSSGTDDCIQQAVQRGITVKAFRPS